MPKPEETAGAAADAPGVAAGEEGAASGAGKGEKEGKEEKEDEEERGEEPAVARLLTSLLRRLPTIKYRHRTYWDYFRLLKKLARLGPEERSWLVHQGSAIGRLSLFYTDPHPLRGFNQRPGYGSEPARRINPPACRPMAQTLALLVASCSTDTLPSGGTAFLSPTQAQKTLLPLPKLSRDCLVGGLVFSLPAHLAGRDPVIPFMIADRECREPALSMCLHWSWGNLALSRTLIEYATRGLTAEHRSGLGELYRTYFELLAGLLSLRDAYQNQRTAAALPELCNLIRRVVDRRSGAGDERFLSLATKYLLLLGLREKPVTEWLIRHEEMTEGWFEDFKSAREGGRGGR